MFQSGGDTIGFIQFERYKYNVILPVRGNLSIGPDSVRERAGWIPGFRDSTGQMFWIFLGERGNGQDIIMQYENYSVFMRRCRGSKIKGIL